MKRIAAAMMAMMLLSGCAIGAKAARDNMDNFLSKAPRNMDSVALQKQESWHYWLWARPNTTVGEAADAAKECKNVPKATPGETAGQVATTVGAGVLLGGAGLALVGDQEDVRVRLATDACMRGKGYTNGLEGKV